MNSVIDRALSRLVSQVFFSVHSKAVSAVFPTDLDKYKTTEERERNV